MWSNKTSAVKKFLIIIIKKNPFHLVELSGNEVFLEGLLLTSAQDRRTLSEGMGKAGQK
jgi:hypothetical protein